MKRLVAGVFFMLGSLASAHDSTINIAGHIDPSLRILGGTVTYRPDAWLCSSTDLMPDVRVNKDPEKEKKIEVPVTQDSNGNFNLVFDTSSGEGGVCKWKTYRISVNISNGEYTDNLFILVNSDVTNESTGNWPQLSQYNQLKCDPDDSDLPVGLWGCQPTSGRRNYFSGFVLPQESPESSFVIDIVK